MIDLLEMDRMVKMKTLNPHISCRICQGYLIEATTVIECLHTFCKSCLVKHLEDKITCPTCEITIHQSHPLQYISYDRTMQDIVYKLVPELPLNEIKREKEFYKKRGIPYPKTIKTLGEKDMARCTSKLSPNQDYNNQNYPNQHNNLTNGSNDYHRTDEQVNLELVSGNPSQLKDIKRKYVRISAKAAVNSIRKLLAKTLFGDQNRYPELEIFCNGKHVGNQHSFKFVFITMWKNTMDHDQNKPLRLTYNSNSCLPF